jgi:hypothetical protein
VPDDGDPGRPGTGSLHHAQHRRDELGLRGQQQPLRNRKRQHPLPYRPPGDDVIHPVRRRLRHASRTARQAESASLTAERQQRVVAALAAAQAQAQARAQEAVGQDA